MASKHALDITLDSNNSLKCNLGMHQNEHNEFAIFFYYLSISKQCLSVLGCSFPSYPSGLGSFKCPYRILAMSADMDNENFMPAN